MKDLNGLELTVIARCNDEICKGKGPRYLIENFVKMIEEGQEINGDKIED